MAIEKFGNHEVGNLNSRQVVTVPEIKAGENIENYTLVDLAFDANGDRIATSLSDNTKYGYLACAVEILYDNEPMKEFYIGKDEYFRIVELKSGLRFETSAFSGTGAKGKFAHFDATAKKFVIDDAEDALALNTFQVVDVLNGEYGFGKAMVRLEVLK